METLLFFLCLAVLFGLIHGLAMTNEAKSNPMFAVKPSKSLISFLFMD
jgi:hypothetical protein